ncbi:Short-subunit dehydrogenase [Methylocaldum szegediense]|jgi:NAD(P)-dependent dehydrogenase (short-subunit alcohol dehydrogenase family)|uniref:Short-subunit dehydrogenase n=2 Tax=Methylocaldum szegediense TaxID=73780 RepID=A0ABM9HXX7_9GAMM|nr:Short-subunit dehydrogenase [Methylocaldum szegediense]
MRGRIEDTVTVITGASSGIGRAAALAFVRAGGAVVVAARREEALEELALECEAAGGQALAVPVDVTDAQAVEALARRAVETFGRVDFWINNAAVSLFGRFEATPAADFRRVIETNLLGCVHGARAILPRFREQGDGVLVNVSSGVGKMPQPFANAYVISKHGIVALSDCLRQELWDMPDIHVVTVLPPATDTPLFQQAGNYMGRAAEPMWPVYDPETIARAIVSAALAPRREVIVGPNIRAAIVAWRIVPGLFDRLAARVVEAKHFQDRVVPPTSGNLFEPMPESASVHGGWKRPRQRPSIAWMALAGARGMGVGYGFAGRGRRPR